MNTQDWDFIFCSIFLLIIIGIPMLKALIAFYKWGGWKE